MNGNIIPLKYYDITKGEGECTNYRKNIWSLMLFPLDCNEHKQRRLAMQLIEYDGFENDSDFESNVQNPNKETLNEIFYNTISEEGIKIKRYGKIIAEAFGIILALHIHNPTIASKELVIDIMNALIQEHYRRNRELIKEKQEHSFPKSYNQLDTIIKNYTSVSYLWFLFYEIKKQRNILNSDGWKLEDIIGEEMVRLAYQARKFSIDSCIKLLDPGKLVNLPFDSLNANVDTQGFQEFFEHVNIIESIKPYINKHYRSNKNKVK